MGGEYQKKMEEALASARMEGTEEHTHASSSLSVPTGPHRMQCIDFAVFAGDGNRRHCPVLADVSSTGLARTTNYLSPPDRYVYACGCLGLD